MSNNKKDTTKQNASSTTSTSTDNKSSENKPNDYAPVVQSKYGLIRRQKNPDWYEGCQKKCSYYIPEYFYFDRNGNSCQADGSPHEDYSWAE